MSTTNPIVLSTVNDDESADFTISVDEDDHKFSVSVEDGTAILEYEETLSWRGQIIVSEPRNEVFKLLMQSEEMTAYMERVGATKVRRQKHD